MNSFLPWKINVLLIIGICQKIKITPSTKKNQFYACIYRTSITVFQITYKIKNLFHFLLKLNPKISRWSNSPYYYHWKKNYFQENTVI